LGNAIFSLQLGQLTIEITAYKQSGKRIIKDCVVFQITATVSFHPLSFSFPLFVPSANVSALQYYQLKNFVTLLLSICCFEQYGLA